jgi:HPt (histidine-containing phosphotransfer) domain-containing protein
MDTYIVSCKWFSASRFESTGEIEMQASSEQEAVTKALQAIPSMEVLSCKKKDFLPFKIRTSADTVRYDMIRYEKCPYETQRKNALASVQELQALLSQAEKQLQRQERIDMDNLDQELQEMQEWVTNIAKWKIKPRGQYEATCSCCGEKAVYVDMDIDQTIAALQHAGWQLRQDGPHCAKCVDKELG